MNDREIPAGEEVIPHGNEKLNPIHKTWVTVGDGLKSLGTNCFTFLQCAFLVGLYAFFAYVFTPFYIVSLFLTLLTAVYVLICEKDGQIKSSWLFLFIVSFGCGYIIYILADKRVCYGYNRRRFAEISARAKNYFPVFEVSNASTAVVNDCRYIYNAGGYTPYQNTGAKYFPDARPFFEDMLERINEAEKFLFMEFFIVADGVLFDRFLEVFERKIKEGVDIRFICDDVGCGGVLSTKAKMKLKDVGVKFKIYDKLFAPFNFGQNFRDHRKIVVIDGKTGYIGGCNISDAYTNERAMVGVWKDAGLRLDGAAVDGLSITFMRMWEFATKEKLNYDEFLGRYEAVENKSNFVPYAGGPEIQEALCRGVYTNAISGAHEKLYIMTPYFIPDGEIFSQIKAKAQSGVDVRLVLPGVPDYGYIYRVTQSNAEKLIRYGVKVYYADKTFVHSKVCFTENCAALGTVNMDMRSFYEEYDNGVYTDDEAVRADIEADFNGVFEANEPAEKRKFNIFNALIAGVLKIVSPLM